MHQHQMSEQRLLYNPSCPTTLLNNLELAANEPDQFLITITNTITLPKSNTSSRDKQLGEQGQWQDLIKMGNIYLKVRYSGRYHRTYDPGAPAMKQIIARNQIFTPALQNQDMINFTQLEDRIQNEYLIVYRTVAKDMINFTLTIPLNPCCSNSYYIPEKAKNNSCITPSIITKFRQVSMNFRLEVQDT